MKQKQNKQMSKKLEKFGNVKKFNKSPLSLEIIIGEGFNPKNISKVLNVVSKEYPKYPIIEEFYCKKDHLSLDLKVKKQDN